MIKLNNDPYPCVRIFDGLFKQVIALDRGPGHDPRYRLPRLIECESMHTPKGPPLSTTEAILAERQIQRQVLIKMIMAAHRQRSRYLARLPAWRRWLVGLFV